MHLTLRLWNMHSPLSEEGNMKRKLKIFISLLSITTLVSCNKPQSGGSSSDDGPTFFEDKYIVENGVSEYVVLTSKTPQMKESTAANEFVYFMKLATGYNFQVVDDRNIRDNQKYISLGFTTKFAEAFPNYDYSAIDRTQSAFFRATKDDNIYLVCSDDFDGDGVLYGVYELLEDLIDYRYYHDTEIYYNRENTVNLIDYKPEFYRPSYDSRSISTLYTYTNDVHSKRLRLLNNSRGYEWCRACYGHSQIQKYLGPWMLDENGIRYGESHPDWFYDPNMPKPKSEGQMVENALNWCAGDELETVVANKMIEFITNEPNCTFVMCAQEDNHILIDNLPGVREALDTWAKGSQAALQINFINHVIEKVEAWVEVNQPGRELQYLIFAYHSTVEPPLDENGNPFMKLHKKLRIYLAPISSNWSVPFSSPLNKDAYNILEGWNKAAHGQIIIYLYDLNWRMYFANFNNFSAVGTMYRELLKYGITYIKTQGISDSDAPGFQEMRVYVESRLMWNVNQNYDDLAYEFIEQFYKEAASDIRYLYDTIRNRYSYYQLVVDPGSGMGTGNIICQELYPIEFVRQLDIIHNNAFNSIKELEHTEPERYTLLYNRIMKEYLSVIYLKVLLYADYYSQQELKEMRETFYFYTNKFGITKIGEGIAIDGALG